MFKLGKNKLDKVIIQNATIDTIFMVIRKWFEIEKLNANEGAEYERGRLDSIVNFDLSAFGYEEEYERNVEILKDIFTNSEQSFVPTRMRLLMSTIIERFGVEFVDILNARLEYALVHVWGCKKKQAKELIAQFPCLWLMHVVQSFALCKDL